MWQNTQKRKILNVSPAEVAIQTIHADHVRLLGFQRLRIEELNHPRREGKQTAGSEQNLSVKNKYCPNKLR